MKLHELNESIYIQNLDRAPSVFASNIQNLIRKDVELEIDYGDRTDDDLAISFGEGRLPTNRNVVNVGGRVYNKETQYRKLKGVVPTIKTYTDSLEVAGQRFIAKKKAGFKQQGQLIDELPEYEDDYIFQPLVDIINEYRVVVYYMNGRYNVSGIYKKTGSNISVKSIIVDSNVGKQIANIAIKATKELGYSFAGVDVALVSNKNKDVINVTESFGRIASLAMKDIDIFSSHERLLSENYLVVLEVNSMPSMSNPAIYFDLKNSMKKNAL